MADASRKPRIAAAMLACALGLGAVGFSQATFTNAALTDTASASSQDLATGNVLPGPSAVSCTDGVEDGWYLAVRQRGFVLGVTHLNAAFDYRVLVVQLNGQIPYAYTLDASSVQVGANISFPVISGNSNGMSHQTGWEYVARVYSVNRLTGETSNEWRGHKVRQPTVYGINCDGAASGSGYPPGYVPQLTGELTLDGGPLNSLMDRLNSEELLEPLPEDAPLAELPATELEQTPAGQTPLTEPMPSPTEPSAMTLSDETTPAPATEASSSSTAVTVTRRATSQPISTTSKPSPTIKVTVSPPMTTGAATPGGTNTTATTVRANVGDEPINVGTAFARLDEVEGQPRLVVSALSGAEVCTADVPGATRIVSTGGKLTVTVDGRTRNVDLATCEID
ncbi:hypothetical protein ACWIE7_18370 [Dietzia sp. NPDC055343]